MAKGENVNHTIRKKNAESKQVCFLVSISASIYRLALLEPQLDIEEMNK